MRLASLRWDVSLSAAATLLFESGALAYVRESFDYFHLEGDCSYPTGSATRHASVRSRH